MGYEREFSSIEMNLQEKIEKAFEDRRMPDEVVEMEGLLQIDSDVEDALWFKGRNWREVTSRDWQQYNCGLNFMSPDAYLYYLQSLLILTIKNPNDYPDLAISSFINQLDRSPGTENWDGALTDRFLGLSNAEYEAIEEWLLYASENLHDLFWGIAASGPGDGFGRAFDTIAALQRETQLQE
jgi:hypothetical protein